MIYKLVVDLIRNENRLCSISYKYDGTTLMAMIRCKDIWDKYLKNAKGMPDKDIVLNTIRYTEQEVDDPLITKDVMKVVENHGGIDERISPGEDDYIRSLFPNEKFKTKNHPQYGLVDVSEMSIEKAHSETPIAIEINVDTGHVSNGSLIEFPSIEEYEKSCFFKNRKITEENIGCLMHNGEPVYIDEYSVLDTEMLIDEYNKQTKTVLRSSTGGFLLQIVY